MKALYIIYIIYNKYAILHMGSEGTTDAIFIMRQLQVKYIAKTKSFGLHALILRRYFDGVPCEVVFWALRSLVVDEWLVSVVQTCMKILLL